MFNKFLLATLLIIFSTSAMADWTYIASNDTHGFYVDKTEIRKKGNTVKVWEMSDFSKPEVFLDKTYSSSMEKKYYDCENETYKILSRVLYAGRRGSGPVIHSWEVKEDESSIPPNSIIRILWEYACSTK